MISNRCLTLLYSRVNVANLEARRIILLLAFIDSRVTQKIQGKASLALVSAVLSQ